MLALNWDFRNKSILTVAILMTMTVILVILLMAKQQVIAVQTDMFGGKTEIKGRPLPIKCPVDPNDLQELQTLYLQGKGVEVARAVQFFNKYNQTVPLLKNGQVDVIHLIDLITGWFLHGCIEGLGRKQ